jgi:type I restriction enzyme S subunit
MKIVSQCREQARWAYHSAVFEIKKEIPAQTTIKYLNKTGCESIEIAVPKRDEQERGFKLLGGWIESLSKQRNQLSIFRSLKAGFMQDLLTGKKRVTPLLESEVSVK